MRITRSVHAEGIFYLSNQVSQVANAVSNSISVKQPGCDGFVKETILLRIDTQQNETQENSNSDQDALSCDNVEAFQHLPFFKCVCVSACLCVHK